MFTFTPNNADILFSCSVMCSISLVGVIEYELSLYYTHIGTTIKVTVDINYVIKIKFHDISVNSKRDGKSVRLDIRTSAFAQQTAPTLWKDGEHRIKNNIFCTNKCNF